MCHCNKLVEKGISLTFFPKLASNKDPPNLCLLSIIFVILLKTKSKIDADLFGLFFFPDRSFEVMM
jgi:hypothetical protein